MNDPAVPWPEYRSTPGVATIPFSPVPSVDSSVGIGGYRSDLTASVVRPTAAILDLWISAGITHVRVDGSTWEELSVLRGVIAQRRDQGRSDCISVLGGGPVLVSEPPSSEREYWISDLMSLEGAVASAVAQRTGWLDIRIVDAALAAKAIELGKAAGLRISFRGDWDLVDLLGPGDHLPAVSELLRSDGSSPLELLLAWASSAEVGKSRLGQATRCGLTVGSSLLALRRAVFVREAINTPFIEELEPILPHAAYVREMRRPGGYFVGKRHLRQHTGMGEPTKADFSQAEEGWANLLTVVGELPSALVPASRSPQLTSVPGHSWAEECAVLRFAEVPDPVSQGVRLLHPA